MTITRRGRSARGSGELLRGEILDATRDLLAQRGSADDVSIRSVAKAVGVSAPSIYRHFADKQELIDAVVADLFGLLDDVMTEATTGIDSPPERLRQEGLAYVRFAREHPEQYRLATMQNTTAAGGIDQVLSSGAFTNFTQTVTECMAVGFLIEGDPINVALDLWAAAHGIASLLVAKPFLPWGDPEEVADRVLCAAVMGRAVGDLLGGSPTPESFTAWLSDIREG